MRCPEIYVKQAFSYDSIILILIIQLLAFGGKYRVIQQVSDLGWVDLDLGCSTILLGQ